MNLLAVDALNFSYENSIVNKKKPTDIYNYLANLEIYNFDIILWVWDIFSYGLMNSKNVMLDKDRISFIENSERKGKAKVLGKNLIKEIMEIPVVSMVFSENTTIQGMKYLCDTVAKGADLYIHMDDPRFYQFSRENNVNILDSNGVLDYNSCSNIVGMPVSNLPIYQAFAGDMSCLLTPLKNDVSFNYMFEILSSGEFISENISSRSFLEYPFLNIRMINGLLSRCNLDKKLTNKNQKKEIAERIQFLTGGGLEIKEESIFYS